MTAQTFSDALGEISDKYIMEAITYEGKPVRRADHLIRYRIIRTAACLLLAALLSGCTVLAFVPDARAAFFSWIRTQYENTFVYHFSDADKNTDLLSYTLGWLPEGYEEADRVQEGPLTLCTYNGPDDGRLYLTYFPIRDGIITAVTTNGIEPEAVVIHGMTGDFYPSDGTPEESDLIWFDQNENLCFHLSGSFEKTVMLRIAENVRLESP